MFSFLGLESKPDPQPPVPATNADSMFGGMEVESSMANEPASSSFTFLNEGEQQQSAFSFLQEPTVDAATPVVGFSFMSNSDTVSSTEVASSFSFMTNSPEVQQHGVAGGAMVAPVAMPSGAGDSLLQTSGSLGMAEPDIKLNKTALNKQGAAKKKKRATKVGFGRDDEDDADDKSSAQSQAQSQVQSQAQSQAQAQSHVPPPSMAYDTSIYSVPPGAEAAPAMSAISVMSAISAIDVNLHVEDHTHDIPMDAGADSEYTHSLPPPSPAVMTHVYSSAVPSTPPPLPPTMAPAASAPLSSFTAVMQADYARVGAPAAHSPSVRSSVTVTGTVPAPTPVPVPSAIQTPAAAPAVVPASSPVETPVQKLERKSRETVALLTRYLSDLSRLHSSALSGQERFKLEIEAEVSAMQAASKRLEDAEQEQGRLAALEEFDRADALNEVIQRCGAEAEGRQAVLRDLRASVRLLEETYAHERAECISNFHRATSSLRVTREQLDLAVVQMQNSSSRQFDMEEARIRAELERIGLEKGHFQREEEALQGDTERTEEVIRSQTVDLSVKKADLEGSIGVLDDEIRALQQQLAVKMAAQQQLSDELDHVDGRIGEVRKKYDRQLQRIADRQCALEQSKRECLQEESAVLLEQSALEKQVQESKDSNSSAALWTKALESDVTVADSLLRNLTPTASSSASDGSALASISRLEGTAEDATTQELRRNLEAISFLLGKKRAVVGDVQAQRDGLLAESRRVGELMPKLEAEKKAHAANKRFKEAAAVAKELKDLQAAKDATDAEVEQLSNALTGTFAEIAQLEEKHEMSTNELRDAHKQHDVSRFEALLQRAQEVRSLQKEVLRQVRHRKRAAGSFAGIKESDLCEAAALFFASELRTALSEAASIKERHGLAQEITEGAGDASDSEVAEEVEVDHTNTTPESSAQAAAGEDEGSTPVSDADPGAQIREESPRAQENLSADVPAEECADNYNDNSGSRAVENAENPAAAAAAAAESHADGSAVDRDALMVQAKALIASIEDINVRLEEASDYEDYEKAAELFEEASAAGDLLNQLLETLQATKEEVQAYQIE